MHGCSLGDAPLVNAEVDSMGGVVDSGVGIGLGSSPQRAEIENAQAELRREYDVREERRRELEFLEKGGNPLDFKFGNAASLSVQSTSLTDQPPEQLVTSEVKGSFALTASPHGDSVESSGRPEAPVASEPNCADNLLLFDGENDSVDGGRNSVRFVRSKNAPSEQTSQLDSSQNAKGSGESAAFDLPKNRAYKRRIRSRPNRDGGRSSSTDIVPSRGGQVSTLPSHPGHKDVKGSMDTDNQQTPNASSNHISKPKLSNGIISPNNLPSNGVVDMVLDNEQAVESTIGSTEVGLPKLVPDCETNLVNSQRSEGVGKEPLAVVSEYTEPVEERQLVVSPCVDCLPSVSEKLENQPGSVQQNGFRDTEGDEGRVPNEGQSCSVTLTTKGLDSESNCSGTCVSLDRISDSVPLNGLRNDNLNSSVSPNMESAEKPKAKEENKADHRCTLVQGEGNSVFESCRNESSLRPEEELHEREIGLQEEAKHILPVEEMKVDGIAASDIGKKLENMSTDDLDSAKENVCSGRLEGSTDKPALDNPSIEKENAYNGHQDPSVPGLLSQTALPSSDSSDKFKHEILTDRQLKLNVRAHEDSILKEARIIEAKRKRIAQLSVGAFTSENHQKSHWDFVLEEMAWLANDFAQERLWKISAAAQLSHRVASTSRERLAEKSSFWKQKKVAHTLSKAIMDFWLSAEELSKGTVQCPLSNSVRGVQEYAVRYLKYSASFVSLYLTEAPATPERIYDLGSQELSWEQQLTEENLFYTLPPGAMETYRKAIESHLAQVERARSSIQEEVETSMYDAAADHRSQGNTFEEDEGETNTYLLSGDMESGKPSKFAQKKRNFIKSPSARSYDLGNDPPSVQRIDNKFGIQQTGLTVKRPANNLHVSSIPTKRMRTASRPRFTTPLAAGTSGGIQVPNKTDGSSGDNNSFQDDQSTFLGGSQLPDNMEVESVADFERQLPFDSAEVSKPKKKKKPKHLGSTYEQRWQHGNNFQNELGGYSRKRFDKLAESNGSSGLFGQPISKKQKMRHPMDNSLDNYSPMAGSIPSPVASQMSNMANSNKLVKILGGGSRGKKSKLLKMPVGQTGPGSPWSSFEEQALIVLVHDLGPNWELISDAINNILQYKCIFRKPKECSEHHKELISRTAGDGADSAEDSGSSQPYPPALPGIPKGSARALFQRLQEPIEEDMIKVHFDKIIAMSQKQQYFKMQNENKDQKPIQPHSSHALALSQVCPNNINGGPLLTPIDLCDTTASSPDVLSSGYQGTHGGGLTIPNQGGAASLHQTSGANSSLQGSPNMVHGNSFSSPSAPVNSSMRDGRYGVPRSASLSVDEHQRAHQYNQMMPGRVSGTPQGTDRGVRMMAGGNGVGIMCGMNRNINMARPGFPGISPSSVLNSGSMLPSNMAVMAETANLHSGVGVGPGNSMLRPRDSSNMMRPAQVPQHQRQMMVPDHQMQTTQASFGGGISGGLSNQASPSSSQTHPFHHQQQLQSFPQHHHLQGANHASGPQHQAHTIRLAKERHLQLQQQRLLHQHLAASSGAMPRGSPQPQSSLQNSPHIQTPPSASGSLPMTPSSSSTPAMSPHQQKPHGTTRNPQSQMGKQRQRQQQTQNSHPQVGRNHPHPRTQPQQHAKIAKGGVGRGNMTTQQNVSVDPSILNGFSTATTGSQSTEKPPENTMQGQGLYPHHPSNKHLVQQQRSYSGQAKQSQQLASHLDNTNQRHASPPTSGNALQASQQADSSSVTSSSNSQQQLQPTQKLYNQSLQPVQRVLQQNRQINSDSSSGKLLADHSTTAVNPQPSVEIVSVKPEVSSSSGTQRKAPEQMQNAILPKPATQSAPTGNPLTSLSRTKSQGSAEDQTSVSMPTQTQLQTSSLPSSQEQQAQPLQQIQAENSNLHATVRSTDNRPE